MRGYRGFNRHGEMPDMAERLICVFSYLSAGIVGFIWIIFAQIAGKTLRPFVKFHAFQSIFISILYYLFTVLMGILLAFVRLIPFIGNLILSLVFFITQMPILFGFSLLQLGLLSMLVYLIIICLRGQYGNIPWVSDTIKRLL